MPKDFSGYRPPVIKETALQPQRDPDEFIHSDPAKLLERPTDSIPVVTAPASPAKRNVQKVQTNIRFRPETFERLKNYSRLLDMNMNDIIEEALQEYFPKLRTRVPSEIKL
jgi:hypothetical protein